MVGKLFPEAEAYIVGDDMNLKHLDGWTHYFPWEFVTAVETGDLDVSLPEHSTAIRSGTHYRFSVDLLTRIKEVITGRFP